MRVVQRVSGPHCASDTPAMPSMSAVGDRDRQPLLVVVGPTAAGKSTLAETLAQSLDGQLISADALQVYRGLDIGTAKPDATARARVAYHCVDVLDPGDRCTAGDYARRARAAIAQVQQQGQWPILVGGSGFYVQATVCGIKPLPASDPDWRRVLEQVRSRLGAAGLHGALARLDPDRAAQLEPHDTQRVLRSLEVVLRTGVRVADLVGDRPPASLGEAAQEDPNALSAPLPGDVVWLGIDWPRQELYARIERRVDSMLAAGWLEEVQGLLESGLRPEAHALQAIGYRELSAVARGEADMAATRDSIVSATRRYAKRQLSWFRRIQQINWTTLSERGAGLPPEQAAAHILARVRLAKLKLVSC